MKKFISISNMLEDGTHKIDLSVNIPDWVTVSVIAVGIGYFLFKSSDLCRD